MSENRIVYFSQKICKKKSQERPKNCLNCSRFKECEKLHSKSYQEQLERVKKANISKGYMSSLDFQKQFRS